METNTEQNRRTFGEGIAYLLDAYGISGATLFASEEEKLRPIKQLWETLNQKEPALASVIKEQVFIHQLNPQKMDALLSGIGKRAEFKIKNFLANVFSTILFCLKKNYKKKFMLNADASLFEIYLYYKGCLNDPFMINQVFEEIATRSFQEEELNSLEYAFILLDIANTFTYETIFGQADYNAYFTELWRVLTDANNPYHFLLHTLSPSTMNYFYRKKGIANKTEQERISLALSILNYDFKDDLFGLNDSATLHKFELHSYLLELLEWLFQKDPRNITPEAFQELTDGAQYKTFIEQLLLHPVLNFEYFCDKKTNHLHFVFYNEKNEDRKPSLRVIMALLWLTFRRVLSLLPSETSLHQQLMTKIYQIQFILEFNCKNPSDLPQECPASMQKAFEILALLQVDIDKEDQIISHYTSDEGGFDMICNEGKTSFRLMSPHKLNDEHEGKVLLRHLEIEEEKFKEEKSKEEVFKEETDAMIAFIGCFSFRRNDYNQFRLYGVKRSDNSPEGGMALEMNKSFFSNGVDFAQLSVESENPDPYGSNGRALYRCVYMDKYPKESDELKITSISGFKYHDTLSCEEKCREEADFTKRIQTLLSEMLRAIARESLSDNEKILQRLILLQLSYLIKNDDYKEEEECRILMVTKTETIAYSRTFDDINKKIHSSYNQHLNPQLKGIGGSSSLYIEDPRDMRNHIDKVILGDKFAHKDLFFLKARLRMQESFMKAGEQTPVLVITTRSGDRKVGIAKKRLSN